ncbi:MAG TPA: glycosyltransferase family 1 protein [Terriglobales bacterium]|nr:glycosyltransferase family 1 protein [Terriglobales bacterium]
MRIGIDLTSIWRPATGNELLAIEMTHGLFRNDLKNEYVLFFSREVHKDFCAYIGRCEAIMAPMSHELLVKHTWFDGAVKAANLDYIHFPAFPPPWKLSCPMGWTLPDATPWLHSGTMKFKSRWYYKVVGGHAARTNRIVITDSEASRDDLIKYVNVPRERVHVIYPGLRSIFLGRHDSAAFESVRERLGVPREFILFVGTLEPRKNLSRILAAFSKLKTAGSFDPALVIVGRKGWLYNPVFAEIRRLDLTKHVHLTGYVSDDDLVNLYQMASLLVFPSIYEGFGFPAIEAMASRCPVVTSDRGAQFEVTQGCAVHCDPENVDSIAKAIQETHEDRRLRAKLIASGLRCASSFSWDRYAQEFLSVVHQSFNGVCSRSAHEHFASSEQMHAPVNTI